MNCLYQHIERLIKDQFNTINKLSCQPTPRALGNMEYMRSLV